MRYVSSILLLTLAYLALTANPEPGNVVLGVLVATAVSALVAPGTQPRSWRTWPRALMAFLRYLAILAYDLVASSTLVAALVLDPKMPIRPGIVAIPSGCRSDLGVALSAHAISLTPGELVVEVGEDGVMYTHALRSDEAERLVSQAQAMRRDLLEKIFP